MLQRKQRPSHVSALLTLRGLRHSSIEEHVWTQFMRVSPLHQLTCSRNASEIFFRSMWSKMRKIFHSLRKKRNSFQHQVEVYAKSCTGSSNHLIANSSQPLCSSFVTSQTTCTNTADSCSSTGRAITCCCAEMTSRPVVCCSSTSRLPFLLTVMRAMLLLTYPAVLNRTSSRQK